MKHLSKGRITVAILALLAIVTAVLQLERMERGIGIETFSADGIPATLYSPAKPRPDAAAIVVAHGFSGSQQLMQSFALSLARNGYHAVTFDFAGHGRNTAPMTGDITREDGTTVALVRDVGTVIAATRARIGGDPVMALLGHSMASDIIVRKAVSDPAIAATIAVSMFSNEVTEDLPRNLLMITGEWEEFLRQAALDTLAITVDGTPQEDVTYGRFADGSARRAAVAENVEHVGVLYSDDSMQEAVSWMNAVMGAPGQPVETENRGPWLALLMAGVVALAWPLAGLLPVFHDGPPERRLFWRWVAAAALIPAVLTPVLLWPVPRGFLPVLIADYLSMHFALYGLLTGAFLVYLTRKGVFAFDGSAFRRPSFWIATLAVTVFVTAGIGLPLDLYGASFLPHSGRVTLILVLALGILPWSIADEVLCRQSGRGIGAHLMTRLAFLGSLALAITLDLEGLFFLIIIAPVIVLYFLIYGLFSQWLWRSSRTPLIAGIANALAFAWALGVTFPILAA